MSELLRAYRQQKPNDTSTDRQILFAYYREKGEPWMQQYAPDALEEYRREVYKGHEIGRWEEFMRGGRRSWEGTKGTFKAAGSMAATKLGAEDTGRDWLEAAQKNYAEASRPELRSMGKHGLSSLIGEAAPSLLESIGTGVAGAAIGGMVAPGPDPSDVVLVPGGFVAGFLNKHAIKKELREHITRELGEEATEKAVKAKLNQELGVSVLKPYGTKELMTQAATRRGIIAQTGTRTPEQLKAMAGVLADHKKLLFRQSAGAITTGLNSVGLSAGEIYSQLAADPDVDLDTAFNHALVGGTIAGIPDTILPSMILGKTLKALKGGAPLTRKATDSTYRRIMDSWPGRYGKATVGGGATEATTEAFQTWVGIVAEKSAKGMSVNDAIADSSLDNLTWSQQQEMIHAAKVGFVAGVMGGGGGEVFSSLAGGTQPPVDAEPGATPADPTPALEGADPIPVDVAHIDHKGRADVDLLVAEEIEETAVLDADGNLIDFKDPSPDLFSKISLLSREDSDESLREYYMSQRALARAAFTRAPVDAKPVTLGDAPPEVVVAAEAAAAELLPGIDNTGKKATVKLTPADGYAARSGQTTPPGVPLVRDDGVEVLSFTQRGGESEGSGEPAQLTPPVPPTRVVIPPAAPPKVEKPKVQPLTIAQNKEAAQAMVEQRITELEKDVTVLETEIQSIEQGKADTMEELTTLFEAGKIDEAEWHSRVALLTKQEAYSAVIDGKTVVEYGPAGAEELNRRGGTPKRVISNTENKTRTLAKIIKQLNELKLIRDGKLTVLDDAFPVGLLAFQTQEADKSIRTRDDNLEKGESVTYPAFYDVLEPEGHEAGDELRNALDAAIAEVQENKDNKEYDAKNSEALNALGEILVSEGRARTGTRNTSSVGNTTRMVALRHQTRAETDPTKVQILPIHKSGARGTSKKSLYKVPVPAGETKKSKAVKYMTLDEVLKAGNYDVIGSARLSTPVPLNNPTKYSLTQKQYSNLRDSARSQRKAQASGTAIQEYVAPGQSVLQEAYDESQDVAALAEGNVEFLGQEAEDTKYGRGRDASEGFSRADQGYMDDETGLIEGGEYQEGIQVLEGRADELTIYDEDEYAIDSEGNESDEALKQKIIQDAIDDGGGTAGMDIEAPKLPSRVSNWAKDSVYDILEWASENGEAAPDGEGLMRMLIDPNAGINEFHIRHANQEEARKEADTYSTVNSLVAFQKTLTEAIREGINDHETDQTGTRPEETIDIGSIGESVQDNGQTEREVGKDEKVRAELAKNIQDNNLTPSDGTLIETTSLNPDDGSVTIDIAPVVNDGSDGASAHNAKSDASKKEQQEEKERNNLISQEALEKLEQTPVDTREKGVVKALEEYLDKHPELQGIVKLVRGPGAESDSDAEFWAARLQEDGTIAINLNLIQASEVKSNIDHELAHYIYGDGEFTQAFEALWGSLSEAQQNKISVEVARLYGSDLATEEERVRALQFIREETLQTEEQRTLWDKLVALLENIYRKITGGQHSDPQTLAAHMVAHAREAIVTGHQRGDTTVERYSRKDLAALQDQDATLVSFFDTFKDLTWPMTEENKDMKVAGQRMTISMEGRTKAGGRREPMNIKEMDDVAMLILQTISGYREHGIPDDIKAHLPKLVIDSEKTRVEQYFKNENPPFQSLNMNNGAERDLASPLGREMWRLQQEEPESLNELIYEDARKKTSERMDAISSLAHYLQDRVVPAGYTPQIADDGSAEFEYRLTDRDRGGRTGRLEGDIYTPTEAAMIVYHAAKYSYRPDGKRDEIRVDNDHPVMVLTGAGAAYVRDALRPRWGEAEVGTRHFAIDGDEGIPVTEYKPVEAGKTIKEAFEAAAIQMAEDATKKAELSSRKGWHIFKRSKKREDAEALQEAAVGTTWCIGIGGTASSYLSRGDFHAYYDNGVPQVMLRMEGDTLGESPKGRTLETQEIDPAYADVTEDYLRSKNIKGGAAYLQDRDFARALAKLVALGPDATSGDVDPVLREALSKVSKTRLVHGELSLDPWVEDHDILDEVQPDWWDESVEDEPTTTPRRTNPKIFNRIERQAAGHGGYRYSTDTTRIIYNAVTNNGKTSGVEVSVDGILWSGLIVRVAPGQTGPVHLPKNIKHIVGGDISIAYEDREASIPGSIGGIFGSNHAAEPVLNTENLESITGKIHQDSHVEDDNSPDGTGLGPRPIIAPKLQHLGVMRHVNVYDEYPALRSVRKADMRVVGKGASSTARARDRQAREARFRRADEPSEGKLNLPALEKIDDPLQIVGVNAPKLKRIGPEDHKTLGPSGSSRDISISNSHLPSVSEITATSVTLYGTQLGRVKLNVGYDTDLHPRKRQSGLKVMDHSSIQLVNESLAYLVVREARLAEGTRTLYDFGSLKKVGALRAESAIIPGIQEVTKSFKHLEGYVPLRPGEVVPEGGYLSDWGSVEGGGHKFSIYNTSMPDLKTIGTKPDPKTESGYYAEAKKVKNIQFATIRGTYVNLPNLTVVHSHLDIAMSDSLFHRAGSFTGQPPQYVENYMSDNFNLRKLETVGGHLKLDRIDPKSGARRSSLIGSTAADFAAESPGLTTHGEAWVRPGEGHHGHIPLPGLKVLGGELDNGVAINAPKLRKLEQAPSQRHLETYHPNILHGKAGWKDIWGDKYVHATWATDPAVRSESISIPPKHPDEMTGEEQLEWSSEQARLMRRYGTGHFGEQLGPLASGVPVDRLSTRSGTKYKMNMTPERQYKHSTLDGFSREEANKAMRAMRKRFPDAQAFLEGWETEGEKGFSNKLLEGLIEVIKKSGLAKGVKLRLIKQHPNVGSILGSYNDERNEITIYVGDHETLEQMQQTVMHEMLHAILIRAIGNFQTNRGDKLSPVSMALITKLDGMLVRARKEHERREGRQVKWGKEAHPYGLTDLHEFVSEAMTKPDFQNFLAAIEGQTKGENFLQSLIGVLKDIILDVLDGLGLRDGQSKISDSMLGEVIETTLLTIQDTQQQKHVKTEPYLEENMADERVRSLVRELGLSPEHTEALSVNQGGGTDYAQGRRLRKVSDDPTISADPDVSNESALRGDVAVWTKVQDVLSQMFDKFKLDQLNQDGIDFKQFTSRFLKRPKSPEEVIALINQRLVDNGESVIEKLDINDLVNKERAQHDLWEVLMKTFLKMQKNRAKQEGIVKDELDSIEASNAELQELLSNYTDANTRTKASNKALRNFITALSRNSGESGDMLVKVAKYLKREKIPGAVERVQKILAPGKGATETEREAAGNKLMNLVDAVAAIEVSPGEAIDFSAQGIGEAVELIENNISPELQAVLQSITTNPDDQTAALVLMSYIGRDNQHIFDLSKLRSIGKRGEINKILNLVMTSDETAVNKARVSIRGLLAHRSLAERLLIKLTEHKREHRKKVKGMRDAQAFIDFDNSTRKILIEEMASIEGALQIEQRPDSVVKGSSLWKATEGSQYVVPTSPDQSSTSIQKTKPTEFTLIPRKTKGMSPKKYQQKLAVEMEALYLWLHYPGRKKDKTWNYMKRVYDVISSEHTVRDHTAARDSVTLMAAGTFRDQLEQTGSPILGNIIHRIAQFEAFSRRHKELEPLSADWVESETAAIKALGLSKREGSKTIFNDLVYSPALAYFESNQQLLDEHDSVEEAINAGLKNVELMLRNGENLISVALRSNPEAWPAVEELLRLTGSMSKTIIEHQEGMGLKVKHGKGKQEHFRKAIGAELFTVSRSIGGEIATLAIDMGKDGSEWMKIWTHVDEGGVEQSRSVTKSVSDVRKDTAEAYLDPDKNAELRETTKKQYSGNVWNQFVRPLVEQAGESLFDEGGTKGDEDNRYHRRASRSEVIDAFNSVEEGDIVGFAEKLYEITNGNMSGDQASQEAMAEHVGKVTGRLQNKFNVLYSNIDQALNPDAVKDNQITLRRVMLDARTTEGFPSDWVSYSTFEEQQVLSIMRVFSAHAAFGQQLEPLKQEFAAAEREFGEQLGVLESIRSRLHGGKITLAQAKQEAKDLYGPAGWKTLKSASGNLKRLTRVKARILAMIGNEAARTPAEMGASYEVLQMLTGLVVQSGKTAIIDTSSMFAMPFAKFGFNRMGIVQSLRGFSTLTQAAGSFFQALGRQVDMDAGWQTKFNELHHGDQDAMRGGMTRIIAATNREVPGLDPMADSVWGKTRNVAKKVFVYGARAVRELLGTGIMGFGKMGHEARYATLHPHAVFTQAGLWMTAANTINGWKAYHKLVTDAVEYLDANPEADIGKGFRFTHKNVKGSWSLGGHMSEDAFNYMTDMLATYGMSLESLAQEARRKRMAGGKSEVFNNDQLRRLALMAQAEITKETSIMSRPSYVFSSHGGRMTNPLVGWSIEKAADVRRNWKMNDAAGEFNYRLMLQSMMPYLAMMPISLAFVWLRERWEEKMLRKKANILEFKWENEKGESDIISRHNALASLDRFSRVGMFGITGDLANAKLNPETGRNFSIENRVFFLSVIGGMAEQTSKWLATGRPMDYQQMVRPGLQMVGLGGYLEWAQILNTVTGDGSGLPGLSQEAKVTKRLNAENWMRVAGRMQHLSVKPSWRGSVTSHRLVKPHYNNMALGAISNDINMFTEAVADARRTLREVAERDGETLDEDEIDARVRAGFLANHPVRKVFSPLPTETQYKALIQAIPEEYRSDIEAAVEMYNSYGELHLGQEPWRGKSEGKSSGRRKKSSSSGADIREQIMRGARGGRGGSRSSGDRRKEIMRKALGY